MFGSSDPHMVNTLKDKVRELLQDKKFKSDIDIHWTTSETNQQDLPLRNFKANNHQFYSEESSMTIKCHVKTFIMRHLILIVAVSAIGTALTFKIRSWQAYRRVRSVSSNLFKSLKTDLQAKGRGLAGISENEMLQKYMSLPVTKGVKQD